MDNIVSYEMITVDASGLGEQTGVKLGRQSPTNSLKEMKFSVCMIFNPWAAL